MLRRRTLVALTLAVLALAACQDNPTGTPTPDLPATAVILYQTTVPMYETAVAAWATYTAPTPPPVPTVTPFPTATPGVICHVDLNNVSAEILDLCLPRIGAALADAIVLNRGAVGYQTLDDLLRVPGIGPVTVAAIRNCECTVQR